MEKSVLKSKLQLLSLNKLTVILLGLFMCSYSFAREDKNIDIELVTEVHCPYVCDPKIDGRHGYMVELLREIFQPLGYKVNINFQAWPKAIRLTNEGRYHGLLACFKSQLPEGQYSTQSLGIYQAQFYVSSKSQWRYTGEASLEDMKIGIVDAHAYPELNNYKKQHPESIHILEGEHALIKNIHKLIIGRLDVLIENSAAMDYTLKSNDLTQYVKTAGGTKVDYLYLGFSPKLKKAQHLNHLLDKGLKKLRKSGYLQSLLASYHLSDWQENK